MPKFDDTPKWKTRAGAERAIKQATKKPRPKVPTARCPTCGAPRGVPCFNRDGVVAEPHAKRRKAAEQAARARDLGAAKRAGRAKARWAGVTVRYRCPVCGGEHPRAECREAA
jgi:rubredoxin